MIKFKIKDTKVSVDFWFATVIALIGVCDSCGYIWLGVLAAVVHELGHILAMIFKGSYPTEIQFSMFNIKIIDKRKKVRNYHEDMFILAGGPCFNLVVAIISYFFWSQTQNEYILFFLLANIILGVFNLLPISALDGGEILYSFLAYRFGDAKANRIVALCSLLVLVPIATLGFIVLFESRYNFSALFLSIYIILLVLFKDRNKKVINLP